MISAVSARSGRVLGDKASHVLTRARTALASRCGAPGVAGPARPRRADRRTMATAGGLDVNGRSYSLDGVASGEPVVAICVDGCAQEYIDAAVEAGVAPNIASHFGARGLAHTVMPTFTNPNNMAIVTGVPPRDNGICGNFYLDTGAADGADDGSGVRGTEVMMNQPALLRAPTLLSTFAAGGGKDGEAGAPERRLMVVTTKHKLLGLLSHGIDVGDPRSGAVAFSVEHADDSATSEAVAARGWHGPDQAPIATVRDLMAPGVGVDASDPTSAGAVVSGDVFGAAAAPPDIYDPLASIYCLEAGYRMLRAELQRHARARELAGSGVHGAPRPQLVAYLSTTDYVQHKHAPHDPAALAFMGHLDGVLGRLHALGCAVGVTADHGMGDKCEPGSGEPRVLYLESTLKAAGIRNRTILPITDPYVVHHGALGGYGTVYLADASPEGVDAARRVLRAHGDKVEAVLTRAEAAAAFELPADRIGDLVVLGTPSWCIGRAPEYHDVSQVRHLRSHGSVHEQVVPLLFNRALKPDYAARLARGGAGERLPVSSSSGGGGGAAGLAAGALRNFDVFEFLFNGLAPRA